MILKRKYYTNVYIFCVAAKKIHMYITINISISTKQISLPYLTGKFIAIHAASIVITMIAIIYASNGYNNDYKNGYNNA